MQNDSLKGLVGWSGGLKKIEHTSAYKPFDKTQQQPYKHKDKKKGEGGHSIVKRCTINFIDTLRRCSKQFSFDESLIPRRFLTFPNEGVLNNNYDNEQSDYIMRVKDVLVNEQKKAEYIIEDMLGKGTFGQVVKCSQQGTNELFAIKVIKNRPAYFQQAKTEILLLRVLNKSETDQQQLLLQSKTGEQQQQNLQQQQHGTNRIVKLVDYFLFRNHFCLVFEMLELSLYDYLKNTKFCGFSFSLISQWTKSILEGMVIAESKQIIHCDLKPENIMLKNNQLKIIDFGSACLQDKRMYTYIQSRFYRAPEVILGMKYTLAIDMWSLGCILVELFLGMPIFPGNSEYDQLKRIIDLLGKPKNEVIDQGRFRSKFFHQENGEYIFKTKQEFEESEKILLKESKHYFTLSCLSDLKNHLHNSQFRRADGDQKNNKQFELFLDLAQQLLELDPRKRIEAKQAILHPFLNQDDHHFNLSTHDKSDHTKEFSLDTQTEEKSSGQQQQFDSNRQPMNNNQISDFSNFKISDQNAAIAKKANLKQQKDIQDKLKLSSAVGQLGQEQQQQQQLQGTGIPSLMTQSQPIPYDQQMQGIQFSQVFLPQFPPQSQQQQQIPGGSIYPNVPINYGLYPPNQNQPNAQGGVYPIQNQQYYQQFPFQQQTQLTQQQQQQLIQQQQQQQKLIQQQQQQPPQIFNQIPNQQMQQIYINQFQNPYYFQVQPNQFQPSQQPALFMQQQQQQQQQQLSQEQLTNLFNTQLNLNPQQQQQQGQFQQGDNQQYIQNENNMNQRYYPQQNNRNTQKLSKKSLSQQDSLDYQKEFIDEQNILGIPSGFQPFNNSDNIQNKQQQFGFNQRNQPGFLNNFQNNNQQGYGNVIQNDGFNYGFQQGINMDNYSDLQKPPSIIMDIFDNTTQQQDHSKSSNPNFNNQSNNITNNQQQQQYFSNDPNIMNIPPNLQQQTIFASGNINNYPSQFINPDQQYNQGFGLFPQQQQQNMGQQQNQFIMNQNNIQQQQLSNNQFQQIQNPQQQQQQQYQKQHQQYGNSSKNNKGYSTQKQGGGNYNNNNNNNNNNKFQQNGRNNNYKNNNYNNNNNNNYNNNQGNPNNTNNNNNQKYNPNNKKFRRHYSDSQFQQYQPEQNSLFADIKLPFIESDDNSNNQGLISEFMNSNTNNNNNNNNNQEYQQDDTSSNPSQNYHNNITGNEKTSNNNNKYHKSNSNKYRENSNSSNNSNAKHQKQFQKKNSNNLIPNNNNNNNNNNTSNTNFPTNIPFNHTNNNNNNSSINQNINNSQNLIQNNNSNFNYTNSQNQGQSNNINEQNLNHNDNNIDMNNDNNNNNNNNNDHNNNNNNNNGYKKKNKYQNQNKKQNNMNQKYKNNKQQQQSMNQQGQKSFSPINENPSQQL